jgi:hypothetical protein
VKGSTVSRSEIGSQLWNIWMLRWILIVLGKTIRVNINMSAIRSLGYQLKKHKPWFDEGF